MMTRPRARLALNELESRETPAITAVGPEVLAASSLTAARGDPAIAADAAGNTVVVWVSDGQDGFAGGVYAQLFDAAGAAAGPEFQVHTTTYGRQGSPTVAMDADGDFVAAWVSYEYGGDGRGEDVYARRFDAGGAPAGGEFRVSSSSAGNQTFPAAAMAADGGFVVAWRTSPGGGDPSDVVARRFDTAGEAAGAEFRVNTYTTGHQTRPAVAMDAGGDFVVAWESGDQDGDGYGVYAQRYAAAGGPQGGEFRVNTTAAGAQRRPAAAMDADGDFVVTWESQDGSGYGVYAQRYAAAGGAQGGEFRVNTVTTYWQDQSAVAMAPGGAFVVAWRSDHQDGSGSALHAQRFDAAGAALGAEFRVNETTHSNQVEPAVAEDAAGGFMVAWATGQSGTGDVAVRRYAADGAPVTPETAVSTFRPARKAAPVAAADAAGNSVVVWQSGGHEAGQPGGIYARRYDAAGAPVGAEFFVQPTDVHTLTAPAVAMAPTGEFVISWTDYDGGYVGVFARQYSRAGAAVGAPFLVNTATANEQSSPAVAMAPGGGYVIAWRSQGQDGGGSGVYAQWFQADGARRGGEVRVNAATAGDQKSPAVAVAPDGAAVIAWRSAGGGGSPGGVYARPYAVSGQAAGGEILVAADADRTSDLPAVAVADSGAFVVAWENWVLNQHALADVYARTYTAAGQPRGAAVRVNTAPASPYTFPDVAMTPAGDFVVAWQKTGTGVLARQFTGAGDPVGPDQLLAAAFRLSDTSPEIAMDGAGNIIFAREATGAGGTGNGIRVRRYGTTWAPTLTGVPPAGTAVRGFEYAFTASATGHDGAALAGAFSLAGAPAGAAIDPDTGAFSWTPTAAGEYSFEVRVTDARSPGQTAAAPVTVTVAPAAVVGGDLLVGGTAGRDTVVVRLEAGSLNAYIANRRVASVLQAAVTGAVRVRGLEGNDAVTVDHEITRPVELLGGAGSDTLTGAAGPDTLDGGAGDDVLAGRAGDDAYVFGGAWGRDRVAEVARAGADRLDFSAVAAGLLLTKTATVAATSGVNAVTATGVESVAGGAGSDTLRTTAGTNLFTLAGPGRGTVGALAFSGVEALAGGSGADTIKVLPAGSLAGPFRGGLGRNTVDYSAFTAAVTVNLTLGTATGLGGVAGVQAVTGGAGDDLLVGDDAANLLTGGLGRDVLIGGMGADTLAGGDGDDLLVAAFTAFDWDATKLAAVRAEWAGPDDYATRVSHLSGTAGGLNGPAVLGPGTVTTDARRDSITGGAGEDWFITSVGDFMRDAAAGELTTTV